MKTIFGQTRSRNPRRIAFDGDVGQRYESTLFGSTFWTLCLRLEKIVLPPVYISARVYILHGPDVESSNSLELYHSLYQDVICHGGDISFDIIQ